MCVCVSVIILARVSIIYKSRPVCTAQGKEGKRRGTSRGEGGTYHVCLRVSIAYYSQPACTAHGKRGGKEGALIWVLVCMPEFACSACTAQGKRRGKEGLLVWVMVCVPEFASSACMAQGVHLASGLRIDSYACSTVISRMCLCFSLKDRGCHRAEEKREKNREN